MSTYYFDDTPFSKNFLQKPFRHATFAQVQKLAEGHLEGVGRFHR